ncbi:hypothetical protein [Actinophytocola oryzae]|uniref:Uncharacterized protein n=1 Tax=Actinophytocola oryzae TaxID=502181 RepID=A0A4R7V7L8_9PSEU|nr:hypothetical protein [Actinophytocola oryzae]TDV43706.1 hypothetical protein CLV71_115169 [Actinophytocola oryzae]
MSSSLTPVELVIARQLNTWWAAPLQTAQLYAEGLISGAVAVVADADDWRRVPAAVGHAIEEEHEASGFRWTLNADEWQIGIGSIHGLAHGVIESVETGTRYGTETDLHVAWFIYPEDLEDTDLTLEDLATAFDSNVLAAASAFLRACAAMPVR